MAITSAQATYQANVATAGASQVAGNIDYTLAISDMAAVPLMSGATVDPLRATLTRQPFTLSCIADDVLTASSGRLNGLGRLIEIQRSLDGGAYATIGTGRISRMSEAERGLVEVEVSDESWVGRRARIFETTNSVQLHPPGMATAWMDLSAAGTRTYTVVEVSGDAVRIRPNDEADAPSILHVPVSLRESLARDMVAREDQSVSASNSAGNFTSLRFRYDSADRTVITFGRALSGTVLGVTTPNGILRQLSPEGSGLLVDAWVYISGHSLSPTDEITGRFYFPSGAPVSEHVPQHIGGSAGIHPGDLLEDLLDGDYGGPAENYDSTAMTALQALSLRPIWVREHEPSDRKDWIRENILRPYGIAPLVGTDLQVRYVQLRMAQNVAPSGLTELNASNAWNLRWDHGSDVAANIVSVKSRAVRRITNETDRSKSFPVDEYEPVDVEPISIEHDNLSTLGEIVHEVVTSTILERRPNLFSFETLVELSTNTFEVFGDGAVTGSVTVAENTAIEVGDQVLIDCDTVKLFNPGNAARTGERVVRLIAFRDIDPASREFDFLDLGANASVLSAPTVSVAQDGTDANLFNVTISGLAAGTTAHVECEFGATTPSVYRYAKENVGNETVSFRIPDAHSGNIYARAYATAPNRVRSDWGTDSAAISTRALFLDASIEIVGARAVVTWDPASTCLGVRATSDIHERTADASLGSQTDYDAADGGFTLTGFSPGMMVSVRLVPYTGWSDPNVSGSAGDPLDLAATDPAEGRGYWLYDVGIPTITLNYAEDKGVVVNAGGGKDTAKFYVTVGDGSAPSDPSSGANDGEITGSRGEVDTGQTITPGNTVFVKVVAEDRGGNLGPVYQLELPYHRVVISTSTTDGIVELYAGSTPALAATVRGADGYVGSADALLLKSEGQFIEVEGPTSGSVLPAIMLNSGNRWGPHAFDASSAGTGAATAYTTLHTHTWPGDATFVGGRVEFYGEVTGTNDAKGVRITAGGTSSVLFTPVAGDEGDWMVTVVIQEITTATQRCAAHWIAPDGSVGVFRFTRAINTLTTDFVVTLDGITANASDEVTCDLSVSHSVCDGGG